MTKKNPIHKYYFDHPEVWEEINKGRFEREPNFIVKLFNKYGKVKCILDVGCGTGSHLYKLNRLGFDGVGIDLNEKTFSYNLSNEDILTSLNGFMKALKNKGFLIIDVLNPIGFIHKVEFKEKIKSVNEKIGLRFETKHKVDENKQILTETRIVYSLKDNQRIQSDTTSFRLFFPQEIKFFLESAGFKFLSFYGDYDLNHKRLDRVRLITVSQKP
ncbi:class I SAM-dependent methyltransferase [Candidatus Gottesmanbacteria bacterium]|nr:class I SAM-dependent methyltransferase [Candidatus Gottesmanbacteria bacterium]